MITEAGESEIRLVSLASMALELPRLKTFLSPQELQRGNRLLDKVRRDRFYIGRSVLRQMLADYLRVGPESVRLEEGEYGKPFLADYPERDTVHFNVSHAGDYLLLVFASGCEVGCDLEQVREEIPFRSMAERYFSRREREDLFSLEPDQQLAAFYRCWTRKEAYLKGTGTGFSQMSTDFDVSVLPHHPPALVSHRARPGEPARWSISDISVLPPGYCGALAVENMM